MPRKICPSCGAQNLSEEDKFCGECGTELQLVTDVEEVKPAKVKPGPIGEASPAAAGPGPITASGAKLMVTRNGRVGHEFVIDREVVNIGRWDADSGAFAEIDLGEDDPGHHISRRHARISVKGGEYFLEDMGSTNGTYVNQSPRLVPGSPQRLKDGDEIVMGKTFFTFVTA